MSILNHKIDKGNAAALLWIEVELENISTDTLNGLAIVTGIKKNKFKETLKMIMESARDNRPEMEKLLGTELLTRIEKAYPLRDDIDSELIN